MTKETLTVSGPEAPITEEFSYAKRLQGLVETKLRHNRKKRELSGFLDSDDLAIIPPPEERREVVKAVSGSGVEISDIRIKNDEHLGIESNHSSGGFFGAEMVGKNFRRLLENHPPYVDPQSSLLGGYMVNFNSYREPGWNPDIKIPQDLLDVRRKYELVGAIGATQHFCQDLAIGLDIGWQGILHKIRISKEANPDKIEFLTALENVAVGIQAWITHNVAEARAMAEKETDPAIRENLLQMATMNEKLVNQPPETFREACQWMTWYQMAARMYNGSGSLGRLDALLTPFYEKDFIEGRIDKEEAIFHITCFLIKDTGYIQLGGPNEKGEDTTNEVSFMVLEAAHRLKIPANIGVCVGESVDPKLLQRGLEIMVEDKTAMPKFLAIDNTIREFARNGYPLEVCRQRVYSGCHWSAIPGKEYTLNDCVKINFGKVFEVAFKDMMEKEASPSTERLWTYFQDHLRIAVDATAQSIDFQIENMQKVFPELVLDLLCDGPIEKGIDASGGGVEFINLGVDGAALATVADSFAALSQRVEKEKKLTWDQIAEYLKNDWAGPEGERIRLMMNRIPRYGTGGTDADNWAEKVAKTFSELIREKKTPHGYNMLPGVFSWANTIPMGKVLGATPNGRKAGEKISHGSNPDPGFRRDEALTALSNAVANVNKQLGWGNTAPLQLEVDPGLMPNDELVIILENLIRTHFKDGGTQINLNVLNKEQILEANKDPWKYPGLIVRVTGFSAYFASLSPEFRQLVVDRITGLS